MAEFEFAGSDNPFASLSEEERQRVAEFLFQDKDPARVRDRLLELLGSESEGSEADVEEKTPEFSPVQTRSRRKKKKKGGAKQAGGQATKPKGTQVKSLSASASEPSDKDTE